MYRCDVIIVRLKSSLLPHDPIARLEPDQNDWSRNAYGANQQSAQIHGDRAAGFPNSQGVAAAAIQLYAGTREFGKMPFLLILAVDLLCYGLERQDISKSLTGTLMMVAHFVLFTPFSVAWTKLAIHGRRSVANHPAFAYSRTQWMYLLATTVMILALLISVGAPSCCYVISSEILRTS